MKSFNCVPKNEAGFFKNFIHKLCLEIICIYIYMCVCVCVCVCKKDLALNNLLWLICHENQTKPNQTKQMYPCKSSGKMFKNWNNKIDF